MTHVYVCKRASFRRFYCFDAIYADLNEFARKKISAEVYIYIYI